MKKVFSDVLAWCQQPGWWKGNIPYNLRYVAFPLLLLIGLCYLFMCFLGNNCLRPAFLWISKKLSAFWNWLGACLSTKKVPRAAWLALPLLLLIFLIGLWMKSRNGSDVPVSPASYQAYQASWDDALYARVFLDGLESDGRLAGFKYIDGKPAKKTAFSSNPAQEAWDVMEDEWLPVVQKGVSVDLSHNQRVATILYAMRSGEYGFAKSQFLKDVNSGDFVRAAESIETIHEANGRPRKSGPELKNYLHVLRLIFEGGISVDELKDSHCFAYKAYGFAQYQPEKLRQVILHPRDGYVKYPVPRQLIEK